MPLDPYSGKLDLLSLTMLVEGKPVPDVYQITQIRVHKEINRIASAKITARVGFFRRMGDGPFQSREKFGPFQQSS